MSIARTVCIQLRGQYVVNDLHRLHEERFCSGLARAPELHFNGTHRPVVLNRLLALRS